MNFSGPQIFKSWQSTSGPTNEYLHNQNTFLTSQQPQMFNCASVEIDMLSLDGGLSGTV